MKIRVKLIRVQGVSYCRMQSKSALSNQITVVLFQPVQLAQALFLQKNQTLQNGFLISVMLRWHKASLAYINQSF